MENNQSPVSQSTPSDESKTIAMLAWIGTIFFWFIPSLVIFLTKKDDEFIQAHAKEALNLSIFASLIVIPLAILGAILLFTIILAPVALLTSLLQMAVGITALVFCIMGAVKANNKETYKVSLPFMIRLIK